MSAVARFAWGVVAYNIAVVLWGAWVRITGSGAGCGSHWPGCNGEIIPRSPSYETLIEFTHRLTSGLTLLLTVAVVVVVFRSLKAPHPARRASVVTLVFVLAEAALGAGLVLFELVADNSSAFRAAVVAAHLVNTLGLLGAGALTAYFAAGGSAWNWRSGSHRWLFRLSLAALLLVGMTGAITALGDTLFPVMPTEGQGILARIRADLSPAEHFLVRLRILHPILALSAGLFLFYALGYVRTRVSGTARAWLTAALVFVGVELGAGLLNVALAAPGWMQLIHLALADAVWIAVIVAAAAASTAPLTPHRPAEAG